MKNKYGVRSQILEKKFREIIKYFSLDLKADKISKLSGISRPTINKILLKVREKISEFCADEAKFSGIIEVDESYFGPKRIREKRGRGADGKAMIA